MDTKDIFLKFWLENIDRQIFDKLDYFNTPGLIKLIGFLEIKNESLYVKNERSIMDHVLFFQEDPY